MKFILKGVASGLIFVISFILSLDLLVIYSDAFNSIVYVAITYIIAGLLISSNNYIETIKAFVTSVIIVVLLFKIWFLLIENVEAIGNIKAGIGYEIMIIFVLYFLEFIVEIATVVVTTYFRTKRRKKTRVEMIYTKQIESHLIFFYKSRPPA